MKKIFLPILSFAIILQFSSCVSARKYDDLKASKSTLQTNYDNAKAELEQFKNNEASTQAKLNKLQDEHNELKKDYELNLERYESLKRAYEDLNAVYEKMLKHNESLVNSASSEKQELNAALALKEQELNRKTQELRDLEFKLKAEDARLKELENNLLKTSQEAAGLEGNLSEAQKALEKSKQELTQSQTELAAREQRVKELEAAMADQQTQMTDLKNKVSNALVSFNSDELSVSERNGRIYVSLSQNLLFASGSKNLDAKGQSALVKLAEVLKKNNDVSIMIEGHTDADGTDESNWDLSVLRATTIVKELVKNGVPPKNITAAGRGENIPVADNNTTAGKAQNRRTEIILSPNLDKLYDIIND